MCKLSPNSANSSDIVAICFKLHIINKNVLLFFFRVKNLPLLFIFRLLHYHDIEPMDDDEVDEPIAVPSKERTEKEPPKKKKKLSKAQGSAQQTWDEQPPVLEPQVEIETKDDKIQSKSRVPSTDSRSESPSDYMVDYNTLVPNIALECGSDIESKSIKTVFPAKKFNKSDIGVKAIDISKDVAVQRLGSNPSISVRQLFPGEEELPLEGRIEFSSVKERTPEGWEKCSSVIQYDGNTKLLWQELQKPYGNQSSFLRHLILLEKYFRNGDLILSPNASHHAVNYSESVQNRLRAYDNIPSSIYSAPPTMLPLTQNKNYGGGAMLTNAANIPKSTPITLSQLNNKNILIQPQSVSKPKIPIAPPSLVPLQNVVRPPPAPTVKSQTQKIRFPVTKNWRPTLIPIDPTKKTDKKAGLVQVISGGKPYHITLEDYKKMCAIKRTFDLRQKRLQETNKSSPGTSLLKQNLAKKPIAIIPKPQTVTSQTDGASSAEDRVSSPEDKNVLMPKIPKSLTVIPQTVPRKTSRPTSPALLITPKPKASTSKS